jgi:hypothetical protein
VNFPTYNMTTEQMLKTIAESHHRPAMYSSLVGTTVHQVMWVEGKLWLFLKSKSEWFIVRTETGEVWFAVYDQLFLAKKVVTA